MSEENNGKVKGRRKNSSTRKQQSSTKISPPLRHWRKTRRGERALEKIREFEGEKIGPRVLAYLRKIDPFVFEEMLLSAFEEVGFAIRRNHRYTGDGGVDGRLESEDGTRILLQAKRYSSYVKPNDLEDFSKRVEWSDANCGLFVHTGRTGPESHRRKSEHVSVVSGKRLVGLLREPMEFTLKKHETRQKEHSEAIYAAEPRDDLSLDELGLKLFQTFARMEYAMKATGYHRGDGDACADWDRLGRECDDHLSAAESPELKAAIDYIMAEPPRKQVIEKGVLEWKEVLAHGQTQGERLLVYVRRVRNNLFHGGKFNGHWFAQERSEPLLRHSLTILHGCMRASLDVRRAFDEE